MGFVDRVDPELLQGLREMETVRSPVSFEQLQAFRVEYAQLLLERADAAAPREDVLRQDHVVSREDGLPSLLLRRYAPVGLPELSPAIYWIHGGGMIVGSVQGDDSHCEALACETQTVVLSVEYRLAPENGPNAPVEDAFAGLQWAVSHASELGIDPGSIAVAGASAGGGIAAGVALLARDRNGPRIRFQYLMYPMLDDRQCTMSSQEFSGIPSWSRENNQFAWQCLLGSVYRTDQVSPYVAPARMVDLSELPPSLMQVGELDTFRDEDIDYASRLLRAGVPTELHVYPAAYHAWDVYNPEAELTAQAYRDRNNALVRALHR